MFDMFDDDGWGWTAEQPPIVPTNLTSLPSEAREQFPPADVVVVGRVPGHKEDMAVVGCCN